MSIPRNRLLFNICLGLAAYWSLGWYVPGVILSTTLAVFSLLCGLAIIFKYFEGWYGVLFRGDRSAEHARAHLGAIGIPGIAASVVYGGLFTLSWNIAGQPPDWLGTPASNFSRLLLVASCVALYMTPDDQRDRLSLPSSIWLTILMITAVVTAFILGAYAGDDQRPELRPISWTLCPPDRPFWVATHSPYFHSEQSPWRALVKPRRCFKSGDEAQKEGFKAAPVLGSESGNPKNSVPILRPVTP